MNYEEIKRLYTQRFASAGDFDFYFTGALNEDSLRTFCEQYIAPLPGVKKRETYTDLGIRPRKGMLMNRFERELESPQAMLIQLWNGEQPYTLKDAVAADAFGQVLTKRYLKSIREDRGMAYSVGADASLNYGVRNTYSLQVFAPFTPEKCDSVLLLMKQDLHELAKNGVRPDELEEVKRFEIKQYEEQQRNNGYWQGLMQQQNRWNKATAPVISKRSNRSQVPTCNVSPTKCCCATATAPPIIMLPRERSKRIIAPLPPPLAPTKMCRLSTERRHIVFVRFWRVPDRSLGASPKMLEKASGT